MDFECEMCERFGFDDCKYCELGNPCYYCSDYNIETDSCMSEGGCCEIERYDDY